MNKTQIAQIAGIATGAIMVGASIRQSVNIHRREKARREEIEANLQLDLAAIKNAGEVVRTRMASEERFVPSYEWMQQLDEEIEFQKIVIREQ